MTGTELQILGALVATISLWVGVGCILWWHGLPDNKKVWAVAAWIGYCGALSIVSMILMGSKGFLID